MKRDHLLYNLILLLFSFLFIHCDLEKEVDLEFPEYQNQMVVECYLEVGKPYTVVLSESVDFFASPNLPIIENAIVEISHRGETVRLEEGISIDPETGKAFNYFSDKICPPNLNEDFILNITDSLGRSITATTQILKTIPIDTLETIWRAEDSMALVFTRFFDPPNEDNYYRRIFQSGGTLGQGRDKQDFTTSDNFADADNQIVYGTGYNFIKGDTIISTIFHIDRAFYDFQESVQSAVANNGNPFGQPGVIRSNIEGGIGIFTGLSYDRDTLIID